MDKLLNIPLTQTGILGEVLDALRLARFPNDFEALCEPEIAAWGTYSAPGVPDLVGAVLTFNGKGKGSYRQTVAWCEVEPGQVQISLNQTFGLCVDTDEDLTEFYEDTGVAHPSQLFVPLGIAPDSVEDYPCFVACLIRATAVALAISDLERSY